jgi:hypothetical protein
VFCRDEPHRVVGAREGSPLIVGVGKGENFLASDAMALAGVTDQIVYLEEGDVVDLQMGKHWIVSRQADGRYQRVQREVRTVHAHSGAAELGPYRHYMQKEIFEQPRAIADTLEGVGGLDPSLFGDAAAKVFDGVDRVLILACGTSYYAGSTARYWLEAIAGLPTNVEIASEYRYRESVPDPDALVELFDAKFSEALKTVGKRFDFVELYNERDKFKVEILSVIGTDLNGYVLDDCAIDYLEQTPLEKLNPNNILDAEGIKKITELTSREHVLSNNFSREKEKAITKQNVEAREAILALERQQVEAEQKQKREIAEVSAREQSQAQRVQQEERLKWETARIQTEESLLVSEENKLRQIIVAQRNKERTDQVEVERVARDRQLEATERERLVTLAQIERDKAVEVEKRNIQEVIRERVMVERSVVEENQKILDTQEFAKATRQKTVKITEAEMQAQEAMIKQVKAAEADKQSTQLMADQMILEAEAKRAAAEKETHAKKMLAEAIQAETAASGLAGHRVAAGAAGIGRGCECGE